MTNQHTLVWKSFAQLLFSKTVSAYSQISYFLSAPQFRVKVFGSHPTRPFYEMQECKSLVRRQVHTGNHAPLSAPVTALVIHQSPNQRQKHLSVKQADELSSIKNSRYWNLRNWSNSNSQGFKMFQDFFLSCSKLSGSLWNVHDRCGTSSIFQ